MIKLTYQQLRAFNASESLMSKLLNTFFGGQTTYQLKKILDVLNKQGEIAQELWKKNFTQFTNKDVLTAEQQEIFTKQREEFLATTFVINHTPVSILEITKKVDLSVGELLVLEPIVDNIDLLGNEGDMAATPVGQIETGPHLSVASG